jgi:hypothetical protein
VNGYIAPGKPMQNGFCRELQRTTARRVKFVRWNLGSQVSFLIAVANGGSANIDGIAEQADQGRRSLKCN